MKPAKDARAAAQRRFKGARVARGFKEARVATRDILAELDTIEIPVGLQGSIAPMRALGARVLKLLQHSTPSPSIEAAALNAQGAAAWLVGAARFNAPALALRAAHLFGAAEALALFDGVYRKHGTRAERPRGGGAKLILERMIAEWPELSAAEIARRYTERTSGQTVSDRYVRRLRNRNRTDGP